MWRSTGFRNTMSSPAATATAPPLGSPPAQMAKECLAFGDGSVVFSDNYAAIPTAFAATKLSVARQESQGTIDQIDWFESLHPTLPDDEEEKEEKAAVNREAALRSLIPLLDVSGDGFIDREEMHRAMPYASGRELTQAMEECDLDGDGQVSAQEWVAYILKQQEGHDDVAFCQGVMDLCIVLQAPFKMAVTATFMAADKDAGGTLDMFEIASILGPKARPGQGMRLEEIMAEFDADKNGTLDCDEFVNLYYKLVVVGVVPRPSY